MAPLILTPLPSRLSSPRRGPSLLGEYLFICPNARSLLDSPNVWITNERPKKRRDIAKHHKEIFGRTTPDMTTVYNDFIEWGTEADYKTLSELLRLKFPGFTLFRGFHRTEEFEAYVESAGCGGVGKLYGTVVNSEQILSQSEAGSGEAVILFESMAAVLHEYSHKYKYGDPVGGVEDGLQSLFLKELEK